jgi:hypothetical protein
MSQTFLAVAAGGLSIRNIQKLTLVYVGENIDWNFSMGKLTRWLILTPIACIGLIYVGIEYDAKRTDNCAQINAYKWTPACAADAEIRAQNGDMKAMSDLYAVYPNLNRRDRGFYWLTELAKRGDAGSLHHMAAFCNEDPLLSRPKVLELLNKHLNGKPEREEFLKILNEKCPAQNV